MFKRTCVLGAAFLCLVPIVASASPITYVAALTGLSESPPNASPGSGFAIVVVDPLAHTMSVQVSFSDLLAGTTASHIHCCTAAPDTGTVGVASQLPLFPGFPTGVTSGTYGPQAPPFDLTNAASYSAAFITGHGGTPTTAEAALLAGLADGRAYLNIHTTQYPGGEIRGFLHVPEPGSSLLMLGIGLLALRAWRRRQ